MNKFLKYIIFFLLGIVLYYFLMQTIQGQKVVEGFGVQTESGNTGLTNFLTSDYTLENLGKLYISRDYTIARKDSNTNLFVLRTSDQPLPPSFNIDNGLVSINSSNKGYTYNPDIHISFARASIASENIATEVNDINGIVESVNYQDIFNDKSFKPISIDKPDFIEESFILNIFTLNTATGGTEEGEHTDMDLLPPTGSSVTDANRNRFYLLKSPLPSSLDFEQISGNDIMFPKDIGDFTSGTNETDSTKRYIYIRTKTGEDVNELQSSSPLTLDDISDYIILYLKSQVANETIPKIDILMRLSIFDEIPFVTTDNDVNDFDSSLGFSSVYSGESIHPFGETLSSRMDHRIYDDSDQEVLDFHGIKDKIDTDWQNPDNDNHDFVTRFIDTIFPVKTTLSSTKQLNSDLKAELELNNKSVFQDNMTNLLYNKYFTAYYTDLSVTDFMVLLNDNTQTFDNNQVSNLLNQPLITSELYSDIDILRIISYYNIVYYDVLKNPTGPDSPILNNFINGVPPTDGGQLRAYNLFNKIRQHLRNRGNINTLYFGIGINKPTISPINYNFNLESLNTIDNFNSLLVPIDIEGDNAYADFQDMGDYNTFKTFLTNPNNYRVSGQGSDLRDKVNSVVEYKATGIRIDFFTYILLLHKLLSEETQSSSEVTLDTESQYDLGLFTLFRSLQSNTDGQLIQSIGCTAVNEGVEELCRNFSRGPNTYKPREGSEISQSRNYYLCNPYHDDDVAANTLSQSHGFCRDDAGICCVSTSCFQHLALHPETCSDVNKLNKPFGTLSTVPEPENDCCYGTIHNAVDKLFSDIKTFNTNNGIEYGSSSSIHRDHIRNYIYGELLDISTPSVRTPSGCTRETCVEDTPGLYTYLTRSDTTGLDNLTDQDTLYSDFIHSSEAEVPAGQTRIGDGGDAGSGGNGFDAISAYLTALILGPNSVLHDSNDIATNLSKIKLKSALLESLSSVIEEDHTITNTNTQNDRENSADDVISGIFQRYDEGNLQFAGDDQGLKDAINLSKYLSDNEGDVIISTQNIKSGYVNFLKNVIGSETSALLPPSSRTLENEIKLSIALLDTVLPHGVLGITSFEKTPLQIAFPDDFYNKATLAVIM